MAAAGLLLLLLLLPREAASMRPPPPASRGVTSGDTEGEGERDRVPRALVFVKGASTVERGAPIGSRPPEDLLPRMPFVTPGSLVRPETFVACIAVSDDGAEARAASTPKALSDGSGFFNNAEAEVSALDGPEPNTALRTSSASADLSADPSIDVSLLRRVTSFTDCTTLTCPTAASERPWMDPSECLGVETSDRRAVPAEDTERSPSD